MMALDVSRESCSHLESLQQIFRQGQKLGINLHSGTSATAHVCNAATQIMTGFLWGTISGVRKFNIDRFWTNTAIAHLFFTLNLNIAFIIKTYSKQL